MLIFVSLLLGLASGAPSFEQWAVDQGRTYESVAERNQREIIYTTNVKYIVSHNEATPPPSYQLGVGPFTDLTFDEFKNLYLQPGSPQNCSATHHPSTSYNRGESTLPTSVNWVTKGVVTPVKNQGHCGSCWTFSTTGALESHHAINTGKLLGLSEQQLVDCAQAFNNNGCNGGLPSQAFEYIHYTGGLETEESYPYTAKDGPCTFNKSKAVAMTMGSHNITYLDEAAIQQAVAEVGPVSIAYQVASDFQHYTSGVYDSKVCKSLPSDVNHAVLVVGYNTEETTKLPYWLVKNSWGAKWGMEGYFEIVRGKNMCGLSDCASFPMKA